MDKVNVTIQMFFEVKNAELFGGDGSIGYTEINADICTESLSDFDLQEYAKSTTKGFTEFCKVSEEDVRVISRKEYEQNTEED